MANSDFFLEIADDPRIGGKGRSLARLRAAGLPTPDGFVVGDSLFRALVDAGAPADLAAASVSTRPLPPEFAGELARRLRTLGGDSFSVRSSFAAEDAPERVAAGIYQSRVGVAAADTEAAIREVLRSAVGASARAYAAAIGRDSVEPPVAVLIHRHVPGDLSGGAALDPARPDSLVIDARRATVPDPVRAKLESALHALATRHGAIEIEWVAAGATVTFLQLRPYRAPAPTAPWSGSHEVGGSEWQWDAAHNPLPLSAAQAGLVALVDARCRTGFRQRVVRGYLFWAPGGPSPSNSIAPSEIASHLSTLIADAESALAVLGDSPALEAALDTFCTFYERIYGLLRPALHRARAQLTDLLSAHLPGALPELRSLLAGVPSRASERHNRADRIARAATESERQAALADYLSLFGDECAIWDLSAPTHREQPDLLLNGLNVASTPAPSDHPPASSDPRPPSSDERSSALDWRESANRIGTRLPPAQSALFDERLDAARAAIGAGEDDDWIYARLQAAIRRALLAIGAHLHATGALDRIEDVFHLPLDSVRAHAAGTPLPDARALARAGADAYAVALRDPPPLTSAFSPGPLRGSGTGGRAVGRVHWHDPTRRPPPDAILVATTLLPTELPLLQVAALITETGGPLDHVATQARERRLPAIVGAPAARAHLPEGTLVFVDADAGVIIPLAYP